MNDVWIIVIVCGSLIAAIPVLALLLWCCDTSDGRAADDVEVMMMGGN